MPDLIGKKVFHKTFGEGTVVGISKTTVTVAFAKSNVDFAFPQAFKKYLSDQQQPLKSGTVERIKQKIPIEFREPIGFILEQLSRNKFDKNDYIIASFIHNHTNKSHPQKNGKCTIVKVPYNIVNMCIKIIPDGEAKNKFRVIANCLFTKNGKNKRSNLIKNCSDEKVVHYCQEVEYYIARSNHPHGHPRNEVKHWYRQVTQRSGFIGLLGGPVFYK